MPGIMLFLAALMLDQEVGQALAMVSGIVTMVGLILLAQSITDNWASWALCLGAGGPDGRGYRVVAFWQPERTR
ncbi:MAG: hypothetical protein HC804_05495 [Anaerolineae bacterium]|nr:hypothetical protein [Anaerolineae bacterium]